MRLSGHFILYNSSVKRCYFPELQGPWATRLSNKPEISHLSGTQTSGKTQGVGDGEWEGHQAVPRPPGKPALSMPRAELTARHTPGPSTRSAIPAPGLQVTWPSQLAPEVLPPTPAAGHSSRAVLLLPA